MLLHGRHLKTDSLKLHRRRSGVVATTTGAYIGRFGAVELRKIRQFYQLYSTFHGKLLY